MHPRWKSNSVTLTNKLTQTLVDMQAEPPKHYTTWTGHPWKHLKHVQINHKRPIKMSKGLCQCTSHGNQKSWNLYILLSCNHDMQSCNHDIQSHATASVQSSNWSSGSTEYLFELAHAVNSMIGWIRKRLVVTQQTEYTTKIKLKIKIKMSQGLCPMRIWRN